MKHALAILAGSAALAAAQPASASEGYLVPDAVTPWVFEGTISISRNFPIPCDALIQLSGFNDATDTSPPFDHSDVDDLSGVVELWGFGGFCSWGLEIDPLLPGSISYSGGAFTLHDVYLTEPGGFCLGDLTAVLDESTQTLSLSGSLSASTGYPDCEVSGTLTLTSPSSGEVRGPGDPDHDPHQNI